MDPTAWKAEKFRQKRIRPCHYCRKPLTFSQATVDHKKPKSKGGKDKPSNFAISCWDCNHKKADAYHDTKKPDVDPYAPDPWWPKKAKPP